MIVILGSPTGGMCPSVPYDYASAQEM